MRHSPAKSILCRLFFKKNEADTCNTLKQILFMVTFRVTGEWQPVAPALSSFYDKNGNST